MRITKDTYQDICTITADTIDVPANVQHIDVGTFHRLHLSIKTINIHGTDVYVAPFAIAECRGVTEINFRGSIAYLNASCIIDTGITTLSLPGNFTDVPRNCIRWNMNLTALNIITTEPLKLHKECINGNRDLRSVTISAPSITRHANCVYAHDECSVVYNTNTELPMTEHTPLAWHFVDRHSPAPPPPSRHETICKNIGKKPYGMVYGPYELMPMPMTDNHRAETLELFDPPLMCDYNPYTERGALRDRMFKLTGA